MPRPISIMYPPSSSEDDEENENESNENEVEYDDENENTAPTPVDADASIVLSDIVRTGEASRLRRRGAMRLDHGVAGASSGIVTVGRVPNLPVAYDWDDPEADHARDDTERLRSIRGARNSQREPRRSHHSHCEEFPFTLFCGGYDGSDSEDMHKGTPYGLETPYTPSILPLYPPSDTRHVSRPPIRKSNGCGALLHMHVAPRRRQGVWTSKTEATDAVISMDSVYFDRASVTKLVKSACGCVREGIGCAVW